MVPTDKRKRRKEINRENRQKRKRKSAFTQAVLRETWPELSGYILAINKKYCLSRKSLDNVMQRAYYDFRRLLRENDVIIKQEAKQCDPADILCLLWNDVENILEACERKVQNLVDTQRAQLYKAQLAVMKNRS